MKLKMIWKYLLIFLLHGLTHSTKRPGRCVRLICKNLTASYQGAPEKTYTTICDGFKKIFQEPRTYHYSFTLHNIYRADNLAVARITWHLRVTENDKIINESTDQGIDVFQKDSHEEWKIINYLAYPERK